MTTADSFELDRQVLSLPTNVQFCSRCVMSNQRPRITFDANGVCSACTYTDWRSDQDWGARREEFLRLLDRFRREDGQFDVVVPCSGGKDSSMIAHRLKHEFGMTPLTVTFSPPIYSQIGWENLRRFTDAGFDHLLVTPPGDLNRALTRLGFEVFGDHNEVFDRGQMAAPFQIAAKYGISLVMYGENGEAQYGGSSAYNDIPGLPWHAFEDIYYSDSLDKIVKIANEKGYFPELRLEDLHHYRLPPPATLEKARIEMHWFSYYFPWIPQEHYYYAAQNTGFRANPEGRTEGTYSKYAQLDDLTDGFLYYLMFIKFGFGRATSDASHEVRDGHLTREEAVRLVRKYDGEFPSRHFQTFLDYLGIDEDRFWQVVTHYRQPHLWRRDSKGEWQLRERVQ